jgi:hypothetical protein
MDCPVKPGNDNDYKPGNDNHYEQGNDKDPKAGKDNDPEPGNDTCVPASPSWTPPHFAVDFTFLCMFLRPLCGSAAWFVL